MTKKKKKKKTLPFSIISEWTPDIYIIKEQIQHLLIHHAHLSQISACGSTIEECSN